MYLYNFKQWNIYKKIIKGIKYYLNKQTNIHPLLYFIYFLYTHLTIEIISQTFQLVIFILAFILALINQFNMIFIIATFLHQNIYIGSLMFLINLCSCTTKCKLYIFIFSIGDIIFQQTIYHTYFLILFTFIICCQIYYSLLFKDTEQNIQYFTGMASIFTYYLIQIITSYLQFQIQQYQIIILVVCSAVFAYNGITIKIEKIRRLSWDEIIKTQLLGHYLKLIEQQIQNDLNLAFKMKYHNKLCTRVNCYCHNIYQNNSSYLLMDLYNKAIQLNINDIILYEQYIQFLIKNEQVFKALQWIVNWKQNGYFELICRMRLLGRIQYYLNQMNINNIYENQYQYGLNYDKFCLDMAIKINDIINLKLIFWREINKQICKIYRIQDIGYQIIIKMYQLNYFYHHYIKIYQNKLFIFDATVLYAMYLLSTTNFREYSQAIIKNTAKLLEQVYIYENNCSQTFIISTIIKNNINSYINNKNNNLQYNNINLIKNQNQYKLIIDQISTGLCKLIGFNRYDLINQKLQIIIPQGYTKIHSIQLNQILYSQTDRFIEMISIKNLHRNLKLPIRGKNGQLVMGYISIKFQVDIMKGLTIISVIKILHDRSSHLLIDFNGNITEMQLGFNLDLLDHTEVKKYLNRLREGWLDNKIINQQKFQIMVNSISYLIIINSPYLQFFIDKNKQDNPPIHIEVINDDTLHRGNIDNDKKNRTGWQIHHIQNTIQNYDVQSSKSSRGGTSAINIITLFSENNSIQLYRYIYSIFIFIIMCCMSSNIGIFFKARLSWDNTQPMSNPLNDTMNFYALQMLTMKALITIQDQQIYFSQLSQANKLKVSKYFGFQNYELSVRNFTLDMQNAFKSSIQNLLKAPSNELKDEVNKKLSQPIFMGILSNNPLIGSQNITYLQLLLLYVTDLNMISNYNLYNTILQNTYTGQIFNIQNCSYFGSLIDKQVENSSNISIVIHIALMVLIILSIIPLGYLLRKRLYLHQKIFDLLVSIDSQQIIRQINSLQHVGNILRNYKESNQIMKINVLDYEQNMIHGRNDRRSSADNEMVIGLQKYDTNNKFINQNQSSLSKSLQSNNSFKISRINKLKRQYNSTHTASLIKKQFQQSKLLLLTNQRKRSGELDSSGSNIDFNRKIILQHWILYIISISFLVLILVSLLLNTQYNSSYLIEKDRLIKTYENQILFEQQLLIAQVHIFYGGIVFQQLLGVTNQLYALLPNLLTIPIYDYSDLDNDYASVMSNCSTNQSKYFAKYCEYNYSQVILRGQFGALFKGLQQLRYVIDHTQQIYSIGYNESVLNIREKFYYLQSLNLKLQQFIIWKIDLIFNRIIDISQQYNNNKYYLLIINIIWGFICFIIGYIIINNMKLNYIKEIYMITFLNNYMIIKNKRVQSFLELLGRNNIS